MTLFGTSKYRMPKDFIFGVSGSAWQEEGAKPSITDPWTTYVGTPEFLQNPEVRGITGVDVAPRTKGCMGEVLYKQDYKLIADFGLTMRRISVPMEKIEIGEGVFDIGEIHRLLDMILTGHAYGVDTMLTIDHWVQNSWFQKSGGWERADSPSLFANHVEKVMDVVRDSVKLFLPLNEPTVSTIFGYDHGTFPPFVKDRQRCLKALRNKLDAHCRALDVILKYNPNAEIGIAHALEWRSAPAPDEHEKDERYLWDHFVPDELTRRKALHFIGVNNYFHGEPNKQGWQGHDPCTEHPVRSDMPWGMCPEALYHVVKEVHERYGLPIRITEHGHAVREIDDYRRCWHMFYSLRGLHRAIEEGADVRSYCHWSFIDNDEWKYRYDKKFGIFAVDQNDPERKRIPRRSAYLLKAIAQAGGPTEEVEEMFREFVSHPHAAVA